jgi:hypothetical protein
LFPLEKHFKSWYLQRLLQTAWAKGLSFCQFCRQHLAYRILTVA